MSVPIRTPLAKNWTLAIVLVAEAALTRIVCAVLTPTVAPVAGEAIATVGALPTVTVTAAEVVWVPRLFVATAVRATAPEVVGVHAKLNGAVVLVPIATPLARYWTLVMEPTEVVALTVRVAGTLIGMVAAAAGAVIATTGATEPDAVTDTGALVVRFPAASVPIAVSAYVPVAVGVQVIV